MIKIHQFDPIIYPRLIWIVIGERKGASLQDRFDNIQDMHEDCDADVQMANDKTNNKGGVLIRFKTLAAARNTNYVCHESAHAAMYIFDYIGGGFSYDNQEPYCYLVGWIAACIKEAVNNYFHKGDSK